MNICPLDDRVDCLHHKVLISEVTKHMIYHVSRQLLAKQPRERGGEGAGVEGREWRVEVERNECVGNLT